MLRDISWLNILLIPVVLNKFCMKLKGTHYFLNCCENLVILILICITHLWQFVSSIIFKFYFGWCDYYLISLLRRYIMKDVPPICSWQLAILVQIKAKGYNNKYMFKINVFSKIQYMKSRNDKKGKRVQLLLGMNKFQFQEASWKVWREIYLTLNTKNEKK